MRPMMNRFAILAILVLTIFMLGCVNQPTQNTIQNPVQNNTGNTSTQPDTTPTPPLLPQTGTMVPSISPENPVSGDDITITATLLSEYDVPGWQNNTAYSIWIRQFGNWVVTDCPDSPCVATWENVSTGNFEYQIRRTDNAGNVTTDGAYSIVIESGVKTGDTLGPKVVIFHEPENPNADSTITITASVEDISSLEKVEVTLDDVVVKTCPQKVKISQCIATVDASDLDLGTHIYSAYAVDTFGNSTQSLDQNFTVVV